VALGKYSNFYIPTMFNNEMLFYFCAAIIAIIALVIFLKIFFKILKIALIVLLFLAVGIAIVAITPH